MSDATVQCKGCGHFYLIREAEFIGGVPHIGTKVSTEVGCPKCLESDGAIAGMTDTDTRDGYATNWPRLSLPLDVTSTSEPPLLKPKDRAPVSC